jgi:hypothetical protein
LLPTFDFTIYQRNKTVYHNETIGGNFILDILFISNFFGETTGGHDRKNTTFGFDISNKEHWKIFYNGWNHMSIKTKEELQYFYFVLNVFSSLNLKILNDYGLGYDRERYLEDFFSKDPNRNENIFKIWGHNTDWFRSSFYLKMGIYYNFPIMLKKLVK